MKGWKKVLSKPSVTAGMFVMAAGLLLFSGVGGARAGFELLLGDVFRTGTAAGYRCDPDREW